MTHIRKSRSAQLSQLIDDQVNSGATLSRASSASLGLSFSLTGYIMPPEDMADSKPYSDDDDIPEDLEAGTVKERIETEPTLPIYLKARKLLLDPAIHEEFIRLKNLVEEKEKKVKELQDNVAALSFSANGKMGKMLMAKCKTLQEENEEIGHHASEGKIHELGIKLSLQKTQNAEIRNQLEGLCKHVDGLTTDVEKSNEMVYILQEKLEERDSEIKRLKLELQQPVELVEEVKTEHYSPTENAEADRIEHQQPTEPASLATEEAEDA